MYVQTNKVNYIPNLPTYLTLIGILVISIEFIIRRDLQNGGSHIFYFTHRYVTSLKWILYLQSEKI